MGRSEWGIAAAMVFVLAVANFTVPVLFQVRVFTEAFWIRFNTRFDVAGAMAVGWPLWVLPILFLLVWKPGAWIWPRVEPDAPPSVWGQALGDRGSGDLGWDRHVSGTTASPRGD